MRNPIVAGNWKMNGSKASITELITNIKRGADDVSMSVELVLFPPSVFLSLSQKLLTTDTDRIAWGAQNVSAELQGAFTGEISTDMLEEFGCRYVLIGHSERRRFYGESDAVIAAKFARIVQASQLIPILCLGETQAQREQGETDAVLRRQLDAVLTKNAINWFDRAVLAYEPVWAIGTGLSASAEQAQAVHAMLREHVAKYSEDIAKRLRILYGGSVKPENAAELFSMPDIDGGLIGGASLDAEQFLAIARAT